MIGVVNQMMKDLLESTFGPDYTVLVRETFRLADGTVEPDLAVVARSCHEREILFRPRHSEGLNIVPLLVMVLAIGFTIEECQQEAVRYFNRGTSSVCIAEPDHNRLHCFHSDGSYSSGTLDNAEAVFRGALRRASVSA